MVAIEQELPPAVAPAPAVTADAIPLAARRVGASSRQVLAVTLIGTLFLAFFASRDLPSWSERLGDGPAGAALQRFAAEWDDTMATLGLTAMHETLRRTVRRLLDVEWGSAR
jgi:hypothetical protein